MNYSYKRYWEPSTVQVLASSLAIGAVASVVTYPIEFIKTRIQVRAEGIGIRQNAHYLGYNPHKIFREIHESGRGVRGVFEGVDSYVAGRLTHLFVRNLTYKVIYDIFKPYKPSNDLSHREKALISGIAGGIAALASNPFDLLNTRIIADGAIYKPNRRNYGTFAEAWATLQKEGPHAIYRGGFANVVRAVVLNSTLTAPYDYLKEKCNITFGDTDTLNHHLALIYASFFSTLFVLPLDNIRTRLYIQFDDPTKNRVGYRGFQDCILRVLANENILGFYPGYLTAVARIWVYSLLTVGATDYLTTGWKRKAGLKEWQI